MYCQLPYYIELSKLNWNLHDFYFIGIDYVTRDNFLGELDNGVVLCHLAQTISETAKTAVYRGIAKGVS